MHITSDAPWHPNNDTYYLPPIGGGHVKIRNISFAKTVDRDIESGFSIPDVGDDIESGFSIPNVANPDIFSSLDPDLWLSPDFSVVHNQRLDSGFPYLDISTPDLTFTNISSVYSSSFADKATSISLAHKALPRY